jgi:hypothetical protein
MSGFKAGSAQKLPKFHCLGRISEIQSGKVSESQKYNVIPIVIEGFGASRSLWLWFCWRPDWLSADFDPGVFDDIEDGNSYAYVYRKNIHDGSGVSLLRGLAGTDEAFNALATRLQALSPEQANDPAAVQAVLEAFFIDEELGGQKIGYTLKQVRTKTDDVDANGKPIYVREDRHELDKFWLPTTRAIQSRINSAAKNPTTIKTLFAEDDVPF